jgi:hypothetical protein
MAVLRKLWEGAARDRGRRKRARASMLGLLLVL